MNVIISSLNTRILSQKSKIDKLANTIKESQIDIPGVEEHQSIHENPFRYKIRQGIVFQQRFLPQIVYSEVQ